MLATNQLRRTGRAFTLIELLTVIAIMLVVTALAAPNFVTMMKDQKWTTATANLQGMIWRARSLATNVRQDMAVEFLTQPAPPQPGGGDNGTRMWVESKSNLLEHVPNLYALQTQINLSIGQNYQAIYWIICGDWTASGAPVPSHSGSPSLYQAADLDPGKLPRHGITELYGQNAYQSETVALAPGLYVDETNSLNFVNWNSPTAVTCYGADNTKDIRIGPNGALVQSLEPVLCIRQGPSTGAEFKKVQVIKCTGRLIPAR